MSTPLSPDTGFQNTIFQERPSLSSSNLADLGYLAAFSGDKIIEAGKFASAAPSQEQ
jgi:hypothetical protein